LEAQFFGLLGSQDTLGDQAILSGLQGRWSFGLSQFAADTDGIRPNNDDSLRQYDGIVQWQPLASSSVQLELTRSERKSGDLTSAFDPTFFSNADRNEETLDAQRLGLRQQFGGDADLLVSIIRQDRHASLDFSQPGFPARIANNEESVKYEAQFMLRSNWIFGASYFDASTHETVDIPPFLIDSSFEPGHLNLYGYGYFGGGTWPQVQLGVSYDDLDSDIGKQSQINPKIGLIWRATQAVTFRAAAFRVLARRLNSDQGLEPTQLAGFNQLYDDRTGTTSESGSFALDVVVTPRVFAGLQAQRRNLESPAFDTTTGELFFQDQREDMYGAHAYWLATDRLSISLEPRYSDFEHGTAFRSMHLAEVPVSVKFTSPRGVWAALSATAVEQRGEFDVGGVLESGSDQFWVVDAIVAYRLPSRRGTISLEGRNLFGEEFRFQEIDSGVTPRYMPESQFFIRASFGF
jgi:hypothetical protein